MLILTRKPSECIRLNDDISITVVGVRDQKVRFSIEAPESIKVNREVICQRIETEAQEKIE